MAAKRKPHRQPGCTAGKPLDLSRFSAFMNRALTPVAAEPAEWRIGSLTSAKWEALSPALQALIAAYVDMGLEQIEQLRRVANDATSRL